MKSEMKITLEKKYLLFFLIPVFQIFLVEVATGFNGYFAVLLLLIAAGFLMHYFFCKALYEKTKEN